MNSNGRTVLLVLALVFLVPGTVALNLAFFAELRTGIVLLVAGLCNCYLAGQLLRGSVTNNKSTRT